MVKIIVEINALLKAFLVWINIFVPTMYQLLRSILFLFDAEKVHHFSMKSLKALCSIGFVKKVISAQFKAQSSKLEAESLTIQAFGLSFPNPVGLAAGFDKNAKYLRELETLGFGAVEIGTVTPL